MQQILDVKDVVKSFGGLKALNGVLMSVDQGEIVGLIGPNGSGKTTLFNVISGILRPDSGEIYFNGELLNSLEPHEIYRRGLVRSFQAPQLFYRMSVIDNILVAARNQLGDNIVNLFLWRKKYMDQEKKLRYKALNILKLLDLSKMWNVSPINLSGGQLKLLEIGRVLMSDPQMLLLDEPAAGVNVLLAKKIFHRLREINKVLRITLLIVEHRVELISEFADKIFVMHQGKILAEGKPQEILEDAKVIRAYLGEEA